MASTAEAMGEGTPPAPIGETGAAVLAVPAVAGPGFSLAKFCTALFTTAPKPPLPACAAVAERTAWKLAPI